MSTCTGTLLGAYVVRRRRVQVAELFLDTPVLGYRLCTPINLSFYTFVIVLTLLWM